MKYDFTSIMDRHGMDSIAVDNMESPGYVPAGKTRPEFMDSRIPMWVADMNFPTVPTVPAAMSARALHPAYGYFIPREEYFDSIINWHVERNGVTGLKKEHIGYENGVLGGVISALGVMCSKGDKVLVHAPTYIGFTGALGNCGYHIVHSFLVKDDEGVWRMDYADMEEKIKTGHIHAAIMCSPHNPTGRVWERWELEKAMEIFEKYQVNIVSDEIWSDIVMPGHKHIPTQSVSEYAKLHTVAEYAPSKTFNLAGLVGSYHIIYDDCLRDRVDKESSLCHYNEMNVLSMHALIAAYSKEGMEWTDELCETLSGNIEYAYSYIKDHFDGVELFKPEGSYMLYLDCTKWCEKHGVNVDELQTRGIEAGVIWQDGRPFHGPNTIRINLALPLSCVKEAFARLDQLAFNK